MEPEGSVFFSEENAIGLYPELAESSQLLIFILVSHLCLCFSSGLVCSGFLVNILLVLFMHLIYQFFCWTCLLVYTENSYNIVFLYDSTICDQVLSIMHGGDEQGIQNFTHKISREESIWET